MQVCISLQTDNHATHQHPTTEFLQAGCPSCCSTNSVRALKAQAQDLWSYEHELQASNAEEIKQQVAELRQTI